MRAALLGPVEGKISCQSMQHIFLTKKWQLHLLVGGFISDGIFLVVVEMKRNSSNSSVSNEGQWWNFVWKMNFVSN